MNHKLALVLFAFAFIVAIVVGFGGKDDLRPAPAEFRAKFQETLLKPHLKPEPSGATASSLERRPASEHESKAPAPANGRVTESDPLSRDAFVRKYGEKLELTRYERRVIRIDGSGIQNNSYESAQKVDGFRASNVAEVSARAREIFANARSLLGIPENAEFILLPPSPGDSSAQAIIQQSRDGIPISPGGLVTILVGPDGELRALDSSIYPATEIANSVSLAPPERSRKILYVTQSAPVAVLHYAYETRDQGIQKVIDAQTGVVLLERDRRIQ